MVQPHCCPMVLSSTWMYNREERMWTLLKAISGDQLSELARELGLAMILPHKCGCVHRKCQQRGLNSRTLHPREGSFCISKFISPTSFINFSPGIIYFIKFPPRSTASIYCVPTTMLSTGTMMTWEQKTWKPHLLSVFGRLGDEDNYNKIITMRSFTKCHENTSAGT